MNDELQPLSEQRLTHTLTSVVIFLCGAGLAFFGNTGLLKGAGYSVLLGAGWYSKRYDVSTEELLQVPYEVTREATTAALTEVTGSSIKPLAVSALRQIPLGDQLARKLELQGKLNSDSIDRFIDSRSSLVLGASRDGKTVFLHYCLQRYLSEHPNAEVHICDLDYGSTHDGVVRDWFKLPIDTVVGIDIDTVRQQIEHVSNVVSDRANRTKKALRKGQPIPDYKPVLLLVDEMIFVQQQCEEKQFDSLKKAVMNIAIRGLKQNVKCFIGSQSAAVSEVGLNRAQLDQLNILSLYNYSAKTSKDKDNLPAGYELVRDELADLPRVIGGHYAACAYMESRWELVFIPEIDTRQQTCVDSVDALLAEYRQRLTDYDGPVNYSRVFEYLGLASNLRRNDAPEYQAVKAWVDDRKQQLRQEQKAS